jgi:hypothetical protein
MDYASHIGFFLLITLSLFPHKYYSTPSHLRLYRKKLRARCMWPLLGKNCALQDKDSLQQWKNALHFSIKTCFPTFSKLLFFFCWGEGSYVLLQVDTGILEEYLSQFLWWNDANYSSKQTILIEKFLNFETKYLCFKESAYSWVLWVVTPCGVVVPSTAHHTPEDSYRCNNFKSLILENL